MTARIITGDSLDVLPTLALSSVDAIVTDPPYGIRFMNKGWDRSVPGPMYWAQALRVAKPGAYLLAFGGTRTYHRLTCAIEDAGWEIHDCLSWLYGSGFPKHESKLKPAWEPIVLARRPSDGATVLQIDACRLEPTDAEYANNFPGDRGIDTSTRTKRHANDMTPGAGRSHAGGRWPANVVIDEAAAEAVDAQSGELVSGANPTRRRADKFRTAYGDFTGQEECTLARGVDKGGASRFYYCAKTSRAEREQGLDGFDSGALSWSSGTTNPGSFQAAGTQREVRNTCPTVKPIALMRWLVRLVTTPGGTVLDPFTGSGSTGCAAALENLGFIGIERDAHTAEIARARIAAWSPTEGVA